MRCKSSGSEASLELVSRCNSAASLYAAVLFLLYLIVYSVACPKRELLIAVSCELLFFVCLAAWRFMRSKSLDTRAKNAVVAQLTEDIRPLAAARSLYQYLFLGLWLVVCTLGTLDFAALCLAFSGNLKASEALYVNVPTMRLIGAHSAATAEILSGAYVNAGKYQQAEKLYGLVRHVRATVYGPASEPAVGLYADYGDLYALQKRYDHRVRSPLNWSGKLSQRARFLPTGGNYVPGCSENEDSSVRSKQRQSQSHSQRICFIAESNWTQTRGVCFAGTRSQD
jgi:hypothetical protein